MKEVIGNEVRQQKGEYMIQDNGLIQQIFNKLTEKSEAVRYIDFLFKKQFDHIDFGFLECVDINSLFVKYGYTHIQFF